MLLKKFLSKTVDFNNPQAKSKWVNDVVDQIYSLITFANHKVAGIIWYHNDTATAYTLALTQNVHSEIKCFEPTQQTVGESLLGVTHTDSFLSPNEDGHYRLCWDLNFIGSNANHKYHMHLHVNDTMVEAIERHAKVGTATDIIYVAATACLDLVKGDQVSLYIHDETGNSTITVLASMIGIEKLI